MTTKVVLMPEGSDIFLSKCDAITCPVNCVGVMGKGLALEFKKRYPEMFADYKYKCNLHNVFIGRPYLFRMPNIPHIINFPTKIHWRNKSNLGQIRFGMNLLMILAITPLWGIKSIAIPALGCGEGKLTWDKILPVMIDEIKRNGGPDFVELYPPRGDATCQQ